jgi:hypothetical protein
LSAKSGAGCHYILIISDRNTNIIGQFFLSDMLTSSFI